MVAPLIPIALGAMAIKGVTDYLGQRQQGQAAGEALEAQQQASAVAAANARNAAMDTQGLLAGAQTPQEQALGYGYGGAAGAIGEYGDQAAALLSGYGDMAGEARGAGLSTLQGLQSRLGSLVDQGYSGFEQDPGYQFRQQQGEQAIQRAASAAGGRLGGATLKDLASFNSGLASQEFGNYAARQNQLMGAAGQLDSLAQRNLEGQAGIYGDIANQYSATGSNLANLSSGIGTQLAGLNVGQGGALSGIYGSNAANAGNALMGAAGSQTQLAQSMIPAYGVPTQYAGAGVNAVGNTIGNLASNALFLGLSQGGDTIGAGGGGGRGRPETYTL